MGHFNFLFFFVSENAKIKRIRRSDGSEGFKRPAFYLSLYFINSVTQGRLSLSKFFHQFIVVLKSSFLSDVFSSFARYFALIFAKTTSHTYPTLGGVFLIIFGRKVRGRLLGSFYVSFRV